ncbi:MAG: BtpA/SgcQ family protein [Acidimicrobiia bacterium]|nr:BtpA/SgcQ family protein [Acidimicrobiia bacterium]MBT8214169.1 BtpA/SgcQ family protein [Acidimicrobiia bacterium]
MAGSGDIPRLIGMVHLGPLPGSSRYDDDLDNLIEDAVTDAERLEAAGFDGLMIENFGDAPFFADDVPKVTIAAMTRVVSDIAAAVNIPFGVNVLRNDALGALAVAAATDAAFVRVNVLSGEMATDQGTIRGRAAEVARMRRSIAPDTRILADVFVKHATPPPGLTLDQAVADTAERAGADAIVISGSATGKAPTLPTIRKARAAAAGVPIVIGSGATPASAGKLLDIADSLIVGTSIKERKATTNPVSARAATAFVRAARKGKR